MNGLGYGMGSMGFIFWITTVLAWTLMVVAIIALIRWINKK